MTFQINNRHLCIISVFITLGITAIDRYVWNGLLMMISATLHLCKGYIAIKSGNDPLLFMFTSLFASVCCFTEQPNLALCFLYIYILPAWVLMGTLLFTFALFSNPLFIVTHVHAKMNGMSHYEAFITILPFMMNIDAVRDLFAILED